MKPIDIGREGERGREGLGFGVHGNVGKAWTRHNEKMWGYSGVKVLRGSGP